ncbi:TetR/AcrR family transcriptional regulator [Pseudomonas syringae]|uniref:TetR/AcrR family transcriptional regulator n=1 Tax=Pseudomonas syringae TaxID=317 RepID=UPI0006CB14C4|nr:TetR/AcrR family transcriptional regulator [Pseudomonas syringae]ALE00288.1 transcriptional regulator [Pseudomonas syringae UMAF0158]MCK9730027.1 TetR/AcrR family transcriptional regulator [Pseudomonas syringae pv. syringae]MCK9743738.1 TetR/AcrR family transcriptional regulator [Pseudomonas syringae pv. syringae]MCK9768732.1 TetR/AcrR family transcriptional regulator [Pseudomonas syringae pv. syringae]MDU8575630.1 TetR/AcrR family transcriptional regulator [Pseudomonas syringae]
MTINAREAILLAARNIAQSQGYNGLNFRDLAAQVGIKPASIYYHFPSKADLGVAVARRYWQDGAAALETIAEETPDPSEALQRFPEIFRRSLEVENRLCLGTFVGAETDNLPQEMTEEMQLFAQVNIAWLSKLLVAANICPPADSEVRAQAIFSAVAGAQLVARSRSDISLFDTLIDTYRACGPLPSQVSMERR